MMMDEHGAALTGTVEWSGVEWSGMDGQRQGQLLQGRGNYKVHEQPFHKFRDTGGLRV